MQTPRITHLATEQSIAIRITAQPIVIIVKTSTELRLRDLGYHVQKRKNTGRKEMDSATALIRAKTSPER